VLVEAIRPTLTQLLAVPGPDGGRSFGSLSRALARGVCAALRVLAVHEPAEAQEQL
jgi:hypothetical protein